MTREQAINLTSIFKGLLPRMTDVQARSIAVELLQEDYQRATTAIESYAKARSDFVLADFMKCLSPRPAPAVGITPYQRTLNELEQDRDLRRHLDREQLELEEMLKGIDATELSRLRAEVLRDLEGVAPAQAALLARLPVHKSLTLKRLVARRRTMDRDLVSNKCDKGMTVILT